MPYDEAFALIEPILSNMIAHEDSVYRAAKQDAALSETGREGIIQRALAREAVLKSALCSIQVVLTHS